jgi:hypothetical protein
VIRRRERDGVDVEAAEVSFVPTSDGSDAHLLRDACAHQRADN